jgi:uncharacterized protein involved in outer membrane biogenesis
MMRRAKLLLIASFTAVALLLAATAVVPRWLRGKIEKAARATIGRDLTMGGPFSIAWGTLEAGEIQLANAPGGKAPFLARAGRVRIAVDLASLVSSPLRITKVELEDVEIHLERVGGRPNWAFDVPERPPSAQPGGPRLVVDRAVIRRFSFGYDGATGLRPLAVGIDDFDAVRDPATDMVTVRGAGTFNDAPWHLAGTIGTLARILEGRDVEQVLDGGIGDSKLSVSGRLADPLTLGGPSLHVQVAGPDLVEALAVFGLRSPLTGPFRASARFSPQSPDIGVEVDASVGEIAATARGGLDSLLDPTRVEGTIEATGPDASVVGGWTGIAGLPTKRFRVAGNAGWKRGRVLLDAVDVHAGDTRLLVDGAISTEGRSVGTDLAVDASGSDLRELSALCRVTLPAGPFTLRGRFLRRPDALALESTRLTSGATAIEASGTIGEPPGVANMNLTVEGRGPEASWLSPVARLDLPRERFDVKGRVTRDGDAIALHDVVGHLADVAFGIDGRIVPVPGIVGSQAQVRAGGQDLGRLAAHFGIATLPAQPFDAAGHVAVSSEGYELRDVVARVGRMDATVSGRVGRRSSMLDGRVSGDDLSDLDAWGVTVDLPRDRFEVEGALHIDQGGYRVERAAGAIGTDRFEAAGVVGAVTDVAVKASGRSVAALARFFPEPPERLPEVPFEAAARIHRTPDGVSVHDAKATMGNVRIDLDGSAFRIDAPDTSLVSSLLGRPLPEGALHAEGSVTRSAEGYRFDGVSVGIGPALAEVSGTLGAPPELTGTALDVSFEGPDLAAVLGPLTGMSPLPADGFFLAGRVRGDRRRLASDNVSVRLGDSDLAGRVVLALEGKTFLDLDVQGKKLDIGRLTHGFSAPAEEPETEAGKRLLLSEAPLQLDALRALDVRVRLAAGEVTWLGVPLRDVTVDGSIRNGGVTMDRFEGTGANGGRAAYSLSIVPDGNGYHLTTAGRLEGSRLSVFGKHESAASAPTLDFEFDVAGSGRSLHEIAAASHGGALLTLGPGRIPNSWVNTLSSGFLLSLVDTLNPFRKSSPDTPVECGVAAAALDGGKLTVDPIATRTDKLTVVGHGQLRFDTEEIDLVWTLKPRRGVGISAGTIVNPFIKLGGTLASPKLDAKPLTAAATTGAAVATAGITVLLKGLYDRITAEKRVCAQALKKARERRDARTGGSATPSP